MLRLVIIKHSCFKLCISVRTKLGGSYADINYEIIQ